MTGALIRQNSGVFEIQRGRVGHVKMGHIIELYSPKPRNTCSQLEAGRVKDYPRELLEGVHFYLYFDF